MYQITARSTIEAVTPTGRIRPGDAIEYRARPFRVRVITLSDRAAAGEYTDRSGPAIVEQVRFDQAYSFKYSPRPLTAAARWPDDVPAEIKTERLERLQLLISECEQERLSLQVGSRQQVLVEGTSIRDSQAWRGRTRSNQVVNFSSNGRLLPGQLVEVEIVEVRGHTLWGRMLDNG